MLFLLATVSSGINDEHVNCEPRGVEGVPGVRAKPSTE